jgi:hypothetical protein
MSGLFGGGKSKAPSIPQAPVYKPPPDDSAKKKAEALEAKRRRASTILTDDMDDPKTKTILGG